MNGLRLAKLAKRIVSPGSQLNTCKRHLPGSAARRRSLVAHTPDTGRELAEVGKLQSPPCISCDFIRRRRNFGLDAPIGGS